MIYICIYKYIYKLYIFPHINIFIYINQIPTTSQEFPLVYMATNYTTTLQNIVYPELGHWRWTEMCFAIAHLSILQSNLREAISPRIERHRLFSDTFSSLLSMQAKRLNILHTTHTPARYYRCAEFNLYRCLCLQ